MTVHNKKVIKTFQNVTTFPSNNLQMDNPHFSDIDEESAINCLNPKTEKDFILFDFDESTVIECTQSRRRLYCPMLFIKQAP